MKQIEIAEHLEERYGQCELSLEDCENCEFFEECDSDISDDERLRLAVTYLDKQKEN